MKRLPPCGVVGKFAEQVLVDPMFGINVSKPEGGIMKRTSIGAFAKRSPFVIAMVVMLAAADVTTSGALLAQEREANSNSPGDGVQEP
jgi:hypothetical protein